MKSNLSKKFVILAAVVSSTSLGLGLTNAAFATTDVAAVRPPAKTPTPAPVRISVPVALTMQQFNRRVATLPQLASLQAGDIVILSDDGSVTGSIWQGRFVFHPAGSKVQPGAMYARWKDGVVALSPTPANSDNVLPGTLDASYVNHVNDQANQLIKTLVNDGSDSSVLRIPDNAWLFRVDGNGQYTALVDVFVYQSGSQPVPVWYPQYVKDGGTDAAPTVKQPVPIAAGAEDVN